MTAPGISKPCGAGGTSCRSGSLRIARRPFGPECGGDLRFRVRSMGLLQQNEALVPDYIRCWVKMNATAPRLLFGYSWHNCELTMHLSLLVFCGIHHGT